LNEIPNFKFQTSSKFQNQKSKNQINFKIENQMSGQNKPEDLEIRTERFAREVRQAVKRVLPTDANREDTKQLVRASGSVAANYLEASERLSKKDFVLRIKICRKEAKESGLFLRLLDDGGKAEVGRELQRLNQEARELKLIFNAIIQRCEAA
jgi:four helix bundle protein